jgi:outer membrane protein assembly factor BamB
VIHRFVAMITLAGLLAPMARASDFATDKASNWHHWRGPKADGTAPAANPSTK